MSASLSGPPGDYYNSDAPTATQSPVTTSSAGADTVQKKDSLSRNKNMYGRKAGGLARQSLVLDGQEGKDGKASGVQLEDKPMDFD